jgi:hypothetical protein
VLAPLTVATSFSSANSERYIYLISKHVPHLGCLVQYLFAGNTQKVTESNFDDGSQTDRRTADPRTNDCSLTDRCISNPFASKLLKEIFGRIEYTTELSDIFTEQDYVPITPHLFSQGLTDGFAECNRLRP